MIPVVNVRERRVSYQFCQPIKIFLAVEERLLRAKRNGRGVHPAADGRTAPGHFSKRKAWQSANGTSCRALTNTFDFRLAPRRRTFDLRVNKYTPS
jgi:hypothetical protein